MHDPLPAPAVRRRFPTRLFAAALALAVATGVVGSAEGAGAQDVAGTRARVASLAKELDRLQLQSSMQNERFLAVQDEIADLSKQRAANRAEVAGARTRLTTARSQAGSYVVEAYVGAGSDRAVAIGSGDPNQSVNQKVMLEVLRGERTQMADDLTARQADLEDAQQELDALDARLQARKAAADRLRKRVAASVARQEQLLAGANADLRAAVVAEQERMAAAAERVAAARATARSAARPGVVAPARGRSQSSRTRPDTPSAPAGGMASSTAGSPTPTLAPLPVSAPSASAGGVLGAGRSVLGTRYRWGGTSPSTGFDCSGFTSYAWRAAGVSLPRTSRAQFAATQRISASQLQPGDLVFYGSPIHHVAIYYGGGQIIHSPRTGDVVKIAPMRNPSGFGRVR